MTSNTPTPTQEAQQAFEAWWNDRVPLDAEFSAAQETWLAAVAWAKQQDAEIAKSFPESEHDTEWACNACAEHIATAILATVPTT